MTFFLPSCGQHAARGGQHGHRLLVAFGSADAGRLGLGTGLTTSQLFPRVVTSLAKYDLQQAAAGGAHTAVITSEMNDEPDTTAA